MAIGRTFKESLQKCLRSLEIGRSGLGGDGKPWRIGTEVYGDRDILPRDVISRKLSVPNAERIFFIRHALRAGFTIDEIFNSRKLTAGSWCRSKRLWISRRNWPLSAKPASPPRAKHRWPIAPRRLARKHSFARERGNWREFARAGRHLIPKTLRFGRDRPGSRNLHHPPRANGAATARREPWGLRFPWV